MYGLVVPLFGRSFYPEKSPLERYKNDERFNLDRYHVTTHFGAQPATDTFVRHNEAPIRRKTPFSP